MKQIIIIEDDIHLAHEMQENINSIENMHCRHVFINPIDYLENPIEADIFLLDIVMPEMNGLEMIERILKLYPKSVIIMNTIQDDSETIFKALQLGASGYIDKQSFETKFTEVFECIGNGGAYMTPKIARRVIEFFNNPRNIMQELTVREKDIVNGILDGLSYKMIASKHDLALDTVRMYVKKVYRKLSINSKSELFKLMRSRL
ncbi:MAG: response regulator transcription factor [Cryomorphaceae bacterium]|jgi:DNA-binding NarL/FixJ family response regulator|nr:response regulator transcription factor [Cryomorphaceae bacterium]